MTNLKKHLLRDKRWEIFYGDISFDLFVSDKIPHVDFKALVPKDVKEAFKIVDKLLHHSYYEYLFVDIAVGRALQIFEMSLHLRYKELNDGKEWNLAEKPLKNLMGWFHKRHFFERNDYQFLEAIRTSRNHFTHPKGHNFGGSMFFPWINTIADLINGLYDDVELRKQRWKATSEFQSKLSVFLEKGGKFKYMDRVFFIYGLGPVKVDNRVNPVTCYFTLLPIFGVETASPKIPIVLGLPHAQMDLDTSVIDFSWGANKLVLSNELTSEEESRISDFIEKVKTDLDYLHLNMSLLYDAGKHLNEVIKNALEKGSQGHNLSEGNRKS